MKPYQEEYLALLSEVSASAAPSVDSLPPEAFIAASRASDRASREAVARGTRLLREGLFPVLDDILSAPREELDSLQEFAGQLMRGRSQIDAGLHYRIHLALLQYARRKGERDMLIRELYHVGMSLHNLDSMLSPTKLHLFNARSRMCFAEAASYFETAYDEIEDPETRGYIHRCMSNVSLCYDDRTPENAQRKLAVHERAIRILSDPDVRAKTPSLPWDRYLYTTHQQRASTLAYLRSGRAEPEAFAQILESAMIVESTQQRAMREKDLPLEPRWHYAFLAARYHCGALLLPELLDGLYALTTSRPDDDYGYQSLFAHICIPAYLMEYARGLNAHERGEELRLRVERMTRRMLAYITRAPFTDQDELLLLFCRNFLHAYLELPGGIPFFEVLQSVFAARHPAAYARMWIAGRISRQLCEWALCDCPEALSGIPGIPGQGEARREALLDFAFNSGRLYDAGMLHVTGLEALSCRGLFEEEELLLQQHAFLGANLLLEHSSTRPYADIAHGHHVYYDGRGGFPAGFSLRNAPTRPMICLIAVADALASSIEEAASRCRPVRTFDEAIEGLFRGEGTRYAPFAVSLLRDPERRERMREDMRRWEHEAYLDLYRRRAEAVLNEV